jgi:hypothetical protein
MVDRERDGQRRRRRWRMLRPYGTTRISFGMIRTISDLLKKPVLISNPRTPTHLSLHEGDLSLLARFEKHLAIPRRIILVIPLRRPSSLSTPGIPTLFLVLLSPSLGPLLFSLHSSVLFLLSGSCGSSGRVFLLSSRSSESDRSESNGLDRSGRNEG